MFVLPITENSQVSEARRIATSVAGELGFNETERGKVAIVVTEAASNLLKHAINGELILHALESNYTVEGGGKRGSPHTRGIEILALDKGPGMANVSECLEDSFSTSGTSGTGLGAIARLSTVFDIYSQPLVGTALVARLGKGEGKIHPTPNSQYPLEIGVVCLPLTGEEVCGDAWCVNQSAGKSLILVADGLGHGPLAAEASREAVRIFQENSFKHGPKEIIEAAHEALRSTRGAAIAISEIDFTQQTVRFAGVGNIAGVILSPEKNQSMVSYNGTVGHEVRKFQEFVYPWPSGAMLVMHSDGLATQWRLDRYQGLAARHPTLIAGVLYRDFKRMRDDVTVLVAKN